MPRVSPGTRAKWAVMIVVAAAIGVAAWLGCRALSGPATKPNILLISIDTLRADTLGCYGYPRDTSPNLDALAGQATLFEKVVSPVPITLPSHCSMMTGTITPYHGVRNNLAYRLMPVNQTLAESLNASDYTTGAVVSSFVLNHRYGMDQGFDSYDDAFQNAADRGFGAERFATEASDAALTWLGANTDAENFFLFLHYYDPHLPYEPPKAFRDRFGESERDRYDGEVAYVDEQIGRVLDDLKRRGLYDAMLIIVTADHGEMLGEHGEMGHQFFIYESAVKVPLIIKLPGQRDARRVTGTVGLVDLMPTVCSLVGIDVPTSLDGRDLSAQLTESAEPIDDDRSFYSESVVPRRYGAGELWGLVGQRWKYIHTTRPELYDLQSDPGEARDLHDQEPGRARAMDDQLRKLLKDRARNVLPTDTQISREARQRLESLGYVGLGYDADQPGGAYNFDRTRHDPKDLVSYHSRFQAAIAFKAAGEFEEAIPICRQLAAERDDVFTVQIFLARLLSSTFRQAPSSEDRLAEAVRHYDAAIGMNDADASAFSSRGLAHQLLGDREKALADYGRAIELQPTMVEHYVNRAKLLGLMKRWDEVLDDLKKAASLDPENARVPVMRDRLASFLAKWRQIGVGATQAIKQNPRDVGLYVRRAIALDQLGRTQDALADCRRALDLLPPMAADQREKIQQLIATIQQGTFPRGDLPPEMFAPTNPEASP